MVSRSVFLGARDCTKCGGTGKLITSGGLGPNKTCPKCDGTGKEK